MSLTHAVFGVGTVKRRASTLAAIGSPCCESVVVRNRRGNRPQTLQSHDARHAPPPHAVPARVQRALHPRAAVAGVVLGEDRRHLDRQPLIGRRARRRRTPPPGVKARA